MANLAFLGNSRKLFFILLPFLALTLAHLIWGANFVVAKVTLQEIPPMSLAFLRFSLATILLAPFLLTLNKKEAKIKTEHLPKMFAVGLLVVTFNIALFYEGLKRTTAIDASVLSMSIPIISVLGGWWFLREKIYWINFTGIVVGLFGSLVILELPLLFLGNFTTSTLLGNFLILLSCISFVGGAILSKELLNTYSPLIITAASFLVGVITFFIPAVLEYLADPSWVSHLSIVGFLGLLYITILSSICAFMMMNYGLKKTDVIKANLFHYMEPAVAATLAVPLLGERISFSFIIGTVLVVLGVYWGTLGRQHHHHPHLKHHRS